MGFIHCWLNPIDSDLTLTSSTNGMNPIKESNERSKKEKKIRREKEGAGVITDFRVFALHMTLPGLCQPRFDSWYHILFSKFHQEKSLNTKPGESPEHIQVWKERIKGQGKKGRWENGRNKLQTQNSLATIRTYSIDISIYSNSSQFYPTKIILQIFSVKWFTGLKS